MILILQHAKEEGPGTLSDFFRDSSWEVKAIHLYKAKKIYLNFSKLMQSEQLVA